MNRGWAAMDNDSIPDPRSLKGEMKKLKEV
jgi:hypothetical protein